MRTGLRALLVTLAVLALAVPAAFAGPPGGGGKGSGGGKPSWAGGGGKGGPPAWAGQGRGKADAKGAKAKGAKVKKEKHRNGARPEELDGEENGDLNPAFTCFQKMSEFGSAFADMFGTNQNKANAFGKCVSQEAQRQGEGDEEPEEESEENTECGPSTEDPEAELTSEEGSLAEDECELGDEEEQNEEVEEQVFGDGLNPAQHCFAKAIELGDDFGETYGTNVNQANAFGMCVAARAQEQDSEEELEEDTEETSEPGESSESGQEDSDLVEDGEGSEDDENEEGEDSEEEDSDEGASDFDLARVLAFLGL